MTLIYLLLMEIVLVAYLFREELMKETQKVQKPENQQIRDGVR